MPKPTLLLVQIRQPGDTMAKHERECIARRLGARRHALAVANALKDDLVPAVAGNVSAVIIGGAGDFSVHDPRSAEWVARLRRLLDRLLADDLPTFGVCFGHQLLGYHLGVEVRTDERHAELGTVPLQLTEAGRQDPVFRGLAPTFLGHTGHSDHVRGVPSGVELLARSDRLDTQAFRVRGSRFYTTQFHPDMTGAEARARYLAYKASLAGAVPAIVDDAAALFRPGEDAAAGLLGCFFDLVCT